MPEQIMYDQAGYIYEIIQEVKGGFLAKALHEDGDEGDPAFFKHSDLSPIAPTQRLSQDVSALKGEIESLKEQKKLLLEELRASQQYKEKKIKDFSKYKELKSLDAFLNGGITHYVVDRGYGLVHVLPFVRGKDEARSRDEYGEDRDCFKLVSLFGRSNGDLEWRISEYKDGSGGWYSVHLALSEAEAIEKVKDVIISRVQRGAISDELINQAASLNIDLPQDALNEFKEKKKRNMIDNIENYRRAIEKQESELALLLDDL